MSFDVDDVARAARRLERALFSGDAASMRDASRELDERRRRGEDVRVAFPSPHLVHAVAPDDDAAVALCRLLGDPGAFTPPLTWQESIRIGIDTMLRNGTDRCASVIASGIKVDEFDPIGAAREGVWWIWERGLHAQSERAAATHFIEDLLDGKEEVRRSTVEALRPWVDQSEFASVVAQILPHLSQPEKAYLIDDD